MFLLSGVNKTTDSFHRPTHLFLASMFPDICRKVWRPLVEKSLTGVCKLACTVFKGLEGYCGKNDDKSYKLARDVAAGITPAGMMKSKVMSDMPKLTRRLLNSMMVLLLLGS